MPGKVGTGGSLWVDLKLSLYCCGYASATRDRVTSQFHSSHSRLRIPIMTRPLPIAASLVLAVLSVAAFAQTETAAPETAEPAPAAAQPAESAAASTAPTGSAERGKQLTYTCQGCHGVTGYKNAYPNYHVPRIGGQSATYLVNALTEYQKGTRKHPTMQAQAHSFSEQDIADIAAYLSELKP